KAIPYISDFFDFSIYLDADEDVLLTWYVERFLTLRSTAFRNPKSYFHRYATISDRDAVEIATSIWTRIDLPNLRENILPTRQRADLILKKGESHLVEKVALRRLREGLREERQGGMGAEENTQNNQQTRKSLKRAITSRLGAQGVGLELASAA